MQFKDFTEKVILDIVEAVDNASSKSSRDVVLKSSDKSRTIEFDVAITVEEGGEKKGKAGIRVISFAEAGGEISQSTKHSTVSRVSFGVDVSTFNKEFLAKLSGKRKEGAKSGMTQFAS